MHISLSLFKTSQSSSHQHLAISAPEGSPKWEHLTHLLTSRFTDEDHRSNWTKILIEVCYVDKQQYYQYVQIVTIYNALYND